MIKNILFSMLVSIYGTTFLNAEDIAHWSLNDSATVSSASDSVSALDASKVGNVVFETTGALVSSGSSASFDGNSTLEVPYATTLNPNGSFSVDAWVKPTGGSGTRSFVSTRAVEKNGFIVRIESNNKFRFYLGDGEWRYVEGPTAVLNEWTHVLATFESQSITEGVHSGIAKLFINGQLFQFKTLTYKPNTSTVRPFRIGGGGDKDQGVSTVYNFTGDIDEVKIANHVLQPVDLVGYFDNTVGLTREIFYDIPNHGVHLITSNAKFPWYPDVIDRISDFDYPTHLGDNYGVRVRGFITIPSDGNYNFYLASDDIGSLRVSFDGTEDNLQEIASVSGWTNHREFEKYETQKSATFALSAGQVLYTEAFVKEGAGGDHLSVAWSKDGGALEVIAKEHLTSYYYDFIEYQQLMSDAISSAQTLYTQSADDVGTSQGQYSESSRVNFSVAIATAQNKLDTETHNGRNLALAIRALDVAVFEFTGGVKPTKIMGTPFGTDPAWAEDTTYLAAHDGDIGTHFTYLLTNDGYTGIEIPDGRETTVEAIRYYPRDTLFNRMVGGRFQGSVDGISYTTLHTITEEPVAQWYTVDIDDDTVYKFLRYIGPNNSYGNIAELEFLAYQNQELYMLHHEIISVKANTADQILAANSLTAEHGGLLPQFLSYKITQLPTHGEVKVNGLVLALNDTFTQEDIDNDLLTFSADSSQLDDLFKVEVASSVGGILPEVIIDIKIDSDFDGLSDQQEIALGTDFDNADTNGNGISDSWELENGMDPKDTATLANLVAGIDGENGLTTSYNYGRFSKISDFAGKTPAKVTKVANINFANSYWQEFANSGVVHDVGAKFTGYLYVPIEGNYKFILSSDDGSKLFIDGAEIITNDGLHSFTKLSAVVNLSAGFHAIRCEYFEASGNHGCILQWEGPARARQIIPASYFFLSIPEHQALEESIDTDQDGLTDLLEVVAGSDPNTPDTDGDKLLDGEEYHAVYGYQTLTTNVDTDGDSISDYDEIFIFNSNPLIPDFDGTIKKSIVLNHGSPDSTVGEWYTRSEEIQCNSIRGSVEYEIQTDYESPYKLTARVGQGIESSAKNIFDLHFYVDGEYVARKVVDVSNGKVDVSLLTPFLSEGTHKIKIFWNNIYRFTALSIFALTLEVPGGPDGNENGKPDWLDSYISNNYSIKEFPSSSKVSPYQLSGQGRYISKISTSLYSNTYRGEKGEWYNNMYLTPREPREFVFSFEDGLHYTKGSITWEETNILDGGEYTIIRGSSMLLNAVIDGDIDGSATLTIGEKTFAVEPEKPLNYEFIDAGVFEIVAVYSGTESPTEKIIVNVVEAPEVDTPFVWKSRERFWKWPNLSDGLVVQAAGMTLEQASDGFNIKRDEVMEEVNIVARLGENGPIVRAIPTKAFWLVDVVEGFVERKETYEDGTILTNDNVFGFKIPEGMDININTISGVTFLDGSRNFTITKNDFDELDRWTIELLKTVDRSGASCHWYKVYQDGILVGQQNK